MKSFVQKFQNAKRRGLTLIEALLFLGIAAVVIVGAVVLYNNTSNSARANTALTQIQSLSTGVKNLFSSSPNYGTANITPALITGGIAPQNSVESATTLTNPWGGETAVWGNNATFHIYMTNIPQDSCVRLLTAGLLSQGSINAVWVVDGTANAPASRVTAPTATAARAFVSPDTPNPATAATACSGDNNNVYLLAR